MKEFSRLKTTIPRLATELFSEGWAYVINRSTEIEPGSDEIQALQRYYRYDAGH